jgi:hypothetical protein
MMLRALFRRRLLQAAPAVLAMAVASCTDRAADLELRLTSLQNELDHAKAELETANRKESPAPEPPESAQPGVSEIERNYDRSVAEFRQDLERQISDGRVNVTPGHPVLDGKPYTAELGVEGTVHGRPVNDRVIARAGLDGKWTFPSTSEVLDRLNKAPTGPLTAATDTRPIAPRATPEPPRKIVSPMPADSTVVIKWADTPAGARPPAAGRGGRP